jgi:hypothetical protein
VGREAPHDFVERIDFALSDAVVSEVRRQAAPSSEPGQIHKVRTRHRASNLGEVT